MASWSVGADGDRNLTEDLRRKNEVCIVYTRKNRRKAPANSNSAGAGAAERSVGVESSRAEPTAVTSSARSLVICDEVILRPDSDRNPVGQDGKFTENPPVVTDSKNIHFHDTVRGPEESIGGEEALTDGGAEPLHGEVGIREEPQVSACEIAQPELEPTGGDRRCLDSGEKLDSNNWKGTNGECQRVASGRDEQLCGSQTERLNNGKELLLSSAHCDQGDELNDTGHETVLPNGRGESQLSCGQLTMSIGNDAGLLASGHERHPIGGAPVISGNGVLKPVISRVGDRVKVPLSESNSKVELRGLKRKFENELDQVRSLAKRLEAKELQIVAFNSGNTTSRSTYISSGEGNSGYYNQPQLLRANSVVGAGGHPEPRPFRHLNVSVMENNHGVGEYVEKEKRTPKANKLYRNSEFLLGKDRLPPETNKKLKPNGAGKKHGVAGEHGFGFGFGSGSNKNRDKLFRSCSNLLQRLMKHKHGWVFNSPVDAEKLGLSDYHDIIKYPMDFGTIKTRLSQNWYRSARQFAEDVRLVFRNAMTYNPKGQDVHVMAEEVSEIFEDKWASIEKDYFPYQMYYDSGFPTPNPRPHPLPPFIPAPLSIPTPSRSAPPMRTLDRSESVTMPSNPRPRPANMDIPHTGRTPVPKKPKAKDQDKRDMTYEEKQKLSTNLQSLPSEKLDAVVKIINRRNSGLRQHNDEIEVDIDSVEAETLWELDRFVTNYKKSLSKYKRKAQLAEKSGVAAARSVLATNPAPVSLNSQKEGLPDGNINPAPVQVGIQGDNATPSNSSSSSSSDSGSSSSDSDSDSSSAESDAGQSPRT